MTKTKLLILKVLILKADPFEDTFETISKCVRKICFFSKKIVCFLKTLETLKRIYKKGIQLHQKFIFQGNHFAEQFALFNFKFLCSIVAF